MFRKIKVSGFTLIELLIVIAIIGILASIVLVSLSSARERAKIATFKSQAHSIQASAVNHCDDATVTDASSLRSAIENGASLPAGVDWNTTGEMANCGSSGNGTFTLYINSTMLSSLCTATLEQTGITSYTGC